MWCAIVVLTTMLKGRKEYALLTRIMNIPADVVEGASWAMYNRQGSTMAAVMKRRVPITGHWMRARLSGEWFQLADLEEPHPLKKIGMQNRQQSAGSSRSWRTGVYW